MGKDHDIMRTVVIDTRGNIQTVNRPVLPCVMLGEGKQPVSGHIHSYS
jgi:hypothetical protein